MTLRLNPDEAARAIAHAAGKQPESAILSLVRDWLRVHGYDVTRHQQGLGCRKGFPDLTAVRDGITHYIEVKTATGHQSPAQIEFQRCMEAHGAVYIVARGIEDVEGLR